MRHCDTAIGIYAQGESDTAPVGQKRLPRAKAQLGARGVGYEFSVFFRFAQTGYQPRRLA